MTNVSAPVAPVQNQATASERFTSMVLKEFSSINNGVELTAFQKRLCQSYFVKLDQILKEAEKKRLAKSEQYRDAVAVTWENINLNKLALDVVAFSSVGLDPLQPNHLNLIPYKNNSTAKYDIGFIIGYRGCELKAKKYGLDVPDGVIVEVVYANDKFHPIKKDTNNPCDSYTFEIVSPFNRGEIVGGFYYLSFSNNPVNNKIKVFTKDDIEKRKPAYASVEFWGGEREKDEWFTNEEGKREKKVVKVQVDGWYEEMCYKTIFRAAYNSITIDSQKIDEAYHEILKVESDLRQESVRKEILDNANKNELGFDEAEIIPQGQQESPAPSQPVIKPQQAISETKPGPGF